MGKSIILSLKNTKWLAKGLIHCFVIFLGILCFWQLIWGEEEYQALETILDNGLKIILFEEHKAPVVSFQVWYRVGSRNETTGKTGLSHMLEHFMFKGTKKHGPQEFSRLIAQNGGHDNAMTHYDFTMYFETIASDRLEIPIRLEADRMDGLLFDGREFHSELQVVKEERRMRSEDNPAGALYENLSSLAYMAHPYKAPIIGWMSDLGGLTRDDAVQYYHQYYIPNNAFIVVVGDFKQDEVLARIQKHFGSKKKGAAPPELATVEPLQEGERRFILKKEAELPMLAAAYHVPNLRESNGYALALLSVLLGEGKSSRLYKSLVIDKQLALDVDVDYEWLSKDPNLFSIFVSIMPGRAVEEVERELYSELEKIKTTLPSERELEKAKNQLEAYFIRRQDSNYSRGLLLGQFEIMGDWRLINKFIPGVREVEAKQLQRVAQEYLVQDNVTVGVLIPKKDGQGEGK